MNNPILVTLVIGFMTLTIRSLPFVVFKDKVPKIIEYLGKVLPFAIMGMLVVYALKDVTITEYPYGLAEIISLTIVVVLHVKYRKLLLSMFVGTVSYMLLTQLIF